MDENDLLSTNTFIPMVDTTKEISPEFNDEFKKYYKNELEKTEQKRLRDSLSMRSLRFEEDNDSGSLFNTNKFDKDLSTDVKGTRKEKEIRTYVSVDSRDRDKLLFSKPNFFKVFLGRTFYNVKKIRLASIEFPNTNAVINSFNNRIYWRNKEDIDDNIIDNKTGTYPVYNTELRIGSYITTTLKTEITSKTGIVKRRNKTGDYHYFTVTLDTDTDIVTFTSLTLTQSQNNPLTTTTGLGTINVSAIGHGFESGDVIYIVGAKTLAGVSGDTIGGSHTVTKINDDVFEFEVNVKASDSVTGGGNTLKIGKEAPFQLLFGRYQYPIAPNIGFPIEDSSQRVSTYLKSITNFYQIKITTITPHNLTVVGGSCTISGAGVTPSVDGNRIVTSIIDTHSFLVSVNNTIQFSSVDSGVVVFGSNTINIGSVANYLETILVTTFSDHGFLISDKGKSITFYDTITTPDFNTSNTIDAVLSNTQFSVLGAVLPNGDMNLNSSQQGDGGTMPQYLPLETSVLNITNIIVGVHTRFTCPNHNLKAGDQIKLYNVTTNPPILLSNAGVHTVLSVLDSDTFNVNFSTVSYDDTNGYGTIGTKLVKLTFPSHGFNSIVSISNGYNDVAISRIYQTPDPLDPLLNITMIETTTNHLLTTGDTIKITSSNSSPSIDNINYTVIVVSPLIFSISFDQDLTVEGSAGFLNFYPKRVLVTTQLPHNLTSGERVRIMQTNSTPQIDGGGYAINVISEDSFTISYNQNITLNGTSGIMGMTQEFYLYGALAVGGLSSVVLNSQLYHVREIIDENTVTFECNDFATLSEKGGGDNLYITSLLHGFNGVQTNTKNSVLNRSINLEGENYVFLCCPQLATMMNTGSVKNIFARITLDQSPGSVVFSYLSNPKEFDTTPLNQLSELEFSIMNYNNTLYDFNDLDYSFVLEITETLDVMDTFNISSRRGV